MAETLERRSSKSRLSKQDEVEEADDTSPSSETSDATIVAATETPNNQSPEGSPDDVSPDDRTVIKHIESQQSTDSDKSNSSNSQASSKLKLLQRSHAIRDDHTPPPDEAATPVISNTSSPTPPRQSQSKPKLSKLRVDSKGSKNGSQGSEAGTSPCLSRDSSTEMQYTDFTGADLEEFIKMTLNKNPKDRMMLLKLEADLISFIRESNQPYHKFPQMTSYHRMLVHRVAAFFGLDHNIDQSGKAVVVNRSSNTRIPDFRFQDHIQDGLGDDQPKRLILKRNTGSLGSFEEGHRYRLGDKKSKSFEEREEEYEKARARIFNQHDSQSSQEGLLDSPLSSRAGTRQSSTRNSREDLRLETRPWSSTDSSGYGTDSSSHRLIVTKASSFGGVTVLSRNDSRNNSISSGTSSSLGSPMSRPPPIPSSPPCEADLLQHQQMVHSSPPNQAPSTLPCTVSQGQTFYWVASGPESIPHGATIIDPRTGQAVLNSDGTVYRHQAGQQLPIQHLSIQSPSQPAVPPIGQQTLQPSVPSVYPQPNMLGQRQYSGETPGELSSQFSAVSLSSQSSTETLPEPPVSQMGQPSYVMTAPPQVNPPPQHGQQGGYQVAYYPSNQSSGTQQTVRYIYQMPYNQGQTPDGQGQVTIAPTGQYSSQGQGFMPAQQAPQQPPQAGYGGSYHVVGYSVGHSAENYQHQQQIFVQAGQQQYQDVNTQQNYTQTFSHGSTCMPVVQSQVTGGYNVQTNTNPNPGVPQQVVTYQGQGYRPTSPPSQTIVPANPSINIPTGQPLSIGNSMTNINSSGQYVGYQSYPATQTQVMPPGGQQRNQQQGNVMGYPPMGSHSQTLVRPGMSMVQHGSTSVGLQSNVTLAAQASSSNSQFKVVSVEQAGVRQIKPMDMYSVPDKPDSAMMSQSVHKVIPQGTMFRPPTPLGGGDLRMLGAPLQQQQYRTPAPVTQVYNQRPRLPTPPLQHPPPQQTQHPNLNQVPPRLRKQWNKKDSANSSQGSSLDSSDSSR